jgi:RNA polymerase sigma-70 factor (ECF subfamily)
MAEETTTVVIQRYLDELAAGAPTDAVVRALLDRAVRRLHHAPKTVKRLLLRGLRLRTEQLRDLGPTFGRDEG